MSKSDLRSGFNACGVYVFVMTPFTYSRNRRGKFEVDLPGVERNISHFSSIKGEKTMVVCGGSGEFRSLSPAEVKAIGRAAVSGTSGRCKVVCGIGGTNATAVKMAEAAQEVGCDAVLVMSHEAIVKRGDRALWERHRVISNAIDIGMLPFRAPAQTLSIDLVKRFARLNRVVAIKEESGAVDWVRTGRRITNGSVPFITGGGENMVPYYYLAGAVEFTTGMANLTLAKSIALHNAAISSRWKRTMELRDYFEPLTAKRKQLGNQMLKAGLEMMDLAGGPIRASGASLNSSERRKLGNFLKENEVL